jgi:hypothetical protein
MKKEEFIEKYEFKIKFNNENIEYLNWLLEVLKKFDNKVVNCKINKAAEKINPTTQRTTHCLNMTSDYWYFGSNNNSYKSEYGGWVYIDSLIAMIPTSNIIEDKRLKYDKLKECLIEKINCLNEGNAHYALMLENLDSILSKLTILNEEATNIFSLLPYNALRELVSLTNLGGKYFINVK